MTLRLAGLAALALLSSACAFRGPAAVAQPVDYSDSAYYDKPWAPSPSRPRLESASTANDAAQTTAAPASSSAAPVVPAKPVKVVSDAAAGDDFEEAEATPGSECYEAAVKAGIVNGTCTLVSESKYVLIGER